MPRHRRSSLLRVLPSALMFAGLAACGGGSTPTQPTAPAQAVLQVTAAPSPVSLTSCDPPACTIPGFEIATTLTVRESAGTSGRVNSVTFLLRRNSDAAVLVEGTISPASVQVPFAANGTVAIPFTMHAARADVTGPTTMTLTVNATDAAGRAVSATTTVPVNGPA